VSTTIPLTISMPDAANRLVALLERYRDAYPLLEEELARQRALTVAMAEQRKRGEQALSAWRAALSRRWECEVSAQRAYCEVERQLGAYYGSDSAYAQLIAPAHPASGSTASDLLHEVRRLEASLELLTPRPPFAPQASARLRAVAADLAAAIDLTARYEAERRSVLSDQRIAANLYERAYDRARLLLARHLGDHALALPATCPELDLA
jgi:hypothetical protein